MHKIFTLFFCTFITLFCSNVKASSASTSDDACAAAASYSDGQDFVSELPDEILIQRIIACLSLKEIKQLLCSSKRMAAKIITARSQTIMWPEDINERNRYYCVKKMINLELNLWPEGTGPYVLPEIVVMALRNKLTLESFSVPTSSLENGHAHMLALAILLDKNPAIDVNKQFNTPFGYSKSILHIAAMHGTADFIRMLCHRGAIVHTIDSEILYTPLHRAVCASNIDTMQELIEQGANLRVRDNYGLTPLHYTMIYYAFDHPLNLQAIILLLKHGANPYAITPSGSNVLNLAQSRKERDGASSTRLAKIIDYLEEFMATHPPELYE